MLVIVPRGIPRTAFSLARLIAIVVVLRAAGEPPAPAPRATLWGVVGHVSTWEGPDVPYRFVVHPYDGDDAVMVSYRGPDPKLAWGDEVWGTGRRDGHGFATNHIIAVCDWRDAACFERHPEQRR